MISANAKLLQDLIRSRVQLQKIEARVFARDYLPTLRQMEREIAAAVARLESGVPLNEISAARLRALQTEVAAIVKHATDSLDGAVGAGVADAASREARVQLGIARRVTGGVVAQAFKGVPVEQLAGITDATVEELMRPFVKSWGAEALQAVKAQLSIAVGMGEDMRQAARRVSQAVGASKSKALTIARTGIQQAAARTADQFHSSNKDVIKGVQYTATLDTRTCPVCAPDDGKVYTYERDPTAAGTYEQRPKLLRHPNCRCVYVPVLRSWRELGADIDDVKLDTETRASMDGQVPDSLNFDGWLKTQPPGRQQAVLGKQGWELWKSGKISLEDFSTANRRRTIDELLRIAGSA